MATKYVSTTGSDSNPGDISQPYLTPKFGLTQIGGGGELVINNGLYTGSGCEIDSQTSTVPSGTAGVRTIVRANLGDVVTLQPPGSSGIRLTTGDPEYLDVRDLIIDMVNQTTVGGAGSSGVHISNASHHVRLTRVTVKDNKANGFGAGQNAHHCEWFACIARNIGDVGTPNSGYGWYVSTPDNLVQDCEVDGAVGYGMHFYDNSGPKNINRNLIERAWIHDCGTGGGTNFGIIFGWGADNIARNNKIVRCRGGVQFYTGSTNAQALNNTIVDCVNEGIAAQYYDSSPTAKNNIVRNCGSTLVDYGGSGVLVQSHNLTTDPTFTNAGADDYTLQVSSTAIDVGADLSVSVPDDFDGNTRPAGAAFDIGAYEFGSTGGGGGGGGSGGGSGGGGTGSAPDNLRASLIGLALSFVMLLPSPDSISAADRQDLLQLASEPAAAPPGSPAMFVQSVSQFAQSPGGTTFAAPAMTTTLGHTIIVAIRVFVSHVTSVTDTAGNPYTQAGFTDDGNTHLYVYYATNIIPHASNVVTGHFDFTVSGVHIIACEYSGISGGPFTKLAEGIDFATPTTSGSFDVTAPGMLIFVAMQSSGNGTWTPGGGYTERAEVGGSPSSLAVMDRVAATVETGSTASASFSVAGFRSIMVVGFTAGSWTPTFPPPTANPIPGDPVGAIYVARVVHSGSVVVSRGETIIRNPSTLWDGKIPAGLLKMGKHRRTLAFEGYPAAEMSIELDDTPDPITGVMFWRHLAATATLEGAYIEINRHEAPYGITIGTPWRVFAGKVPEGGHGALEGFRYEFKFRDVLGERFADPMNQPEVPGRPLTLAEFPGMDADFDGQVVPHVLGQAVEDGEGVVRMIPMGRINILAAFGSGLNLDVGVGLIAQQAVYDVVEGYYNILTWMPSTAVFVGQEFRPTPANATGNFYRYTVAGTTGATEPTYAASFSDGSATAIDVGVDNPNARNRIPNALYGVAGGLAVPHKPGWAAVTGLPAGQEYVIYGNPPRAFTPVLWDLSHPYSPYIEDGSVVLMWDVIGAMTSPLSGTPILDPVDAYLYVLLNLIWHDTDGIVYGTMPSLPGMTGAYSAVDMNTRDAAKAAGDALGGLVVGLAIAPDGTPEGGFERLSSFLRYGRLRVGQNRHGQLIFARKSYTGTPTLTFNEQQDQITVKEIVSTDRRGTRVEYQYGPRYMDATPPAPTGTTGAPTVAIGGRVPGKWASGLQRLINTAAETVLGTSWGAPRPRTITLDMDTTRDANTAQKVAEHARDEGSGPAPFYDGIRKFEVTGPFERLLMRLGTDGEPLELDKYVEITNSEGMAGTGYLNKPAYVVEIEPDPEPDRCRFVVEILP